MVLPCHSFHQEKHTTELVSATVGATASLLPQLKQLFDQNLKRGVNAYIKRRAPCKMPA
jgi:23S rRNA maturation mini-RNase III